MKKLIILLLLLIPGLSLNAQIKMMIEAELAEINKIKTMKDNGLQQIRVYTVNIDEVEWQEDSTLTTEMFFSPGENTFTEISYSPLYSKTVIKLHDDNYIDSREIFNEKGELTGKTVYKYTGNGLLDKREMYFGTFKSFDEVYEYENSVLNKMKYVSADGVLLSYTVYNSDKWGNITEEIKYNAEDKADFKYEYVYDASGRCLEERIIVSGNSVTSVNYSYDKGKNITEKITKDNNGQIISLDKYSRENGLLKEEFNDSKDSKVRKTYEYKNNLLLQMKYVDSVDVTSYYLRYYYK
jgi:hypothetical protein